MKNNLFLFLVVLIILFSSLTGCSIVNKSKKVNVSDGKILYIHTKTFELGTADKVIIATYNNSQYIEKHYFYYKKSKLVKLNYEYIFADVESANQYYNNIANKDNYQLSANTVRQYNVLKGGLTNYKSVIEELKETVIVSRVEVRFAQK